MVLGVLGENSTLREVGKGKSRRNMDMPLPGRVWGEGGSIEVFTIYAGLFHAQLYASLSRRFRPDPVVGNIIVKGSLLQLEYVSIQSSQSFFVQTSTARKNVIYAMQNPIWSRVEVIPG